MFIKPAEYLGVGINYSAAIKKDIIENLHHLDFIEINTERLFFDKNNQALQHIIATSPVVLHGLSLSLGANHPTDHTYLASLKETLSTVPCRWFSEHLAITQVNGLEIRSLVPVEFTKQRIDCIVEKVKQIQSLSEKLLLLENITYYFKSPGSNLDEAYFISEIIEQSNCGLLLDLNNLYINSINHQYDPYAFIDQLPLGRIVELHIAGCEYIYEMWIDTHASPSRKEVHALLHYVISKTRINAVLIERDANINSFTELLDEVNLIKDIIKHALYCRQ